jgi:undecaprenyl-diphosphatase
MITLPIRRVVVVVIGLVAIVWLVLLGVHSKSGLAMWDQSIWQFSVQHGSASAHSLAQRITSFGVLGVLLPASLFVGVILWWRVRSILFSLTPWVSVVICEQVVTYVKRITAITRPPLESQVLPIHNPSFPSGHTANTTALVVSALLTMWISQNWTRTSKWVATLCGLVIAVSMGATRVVLNVHWLSDVMAGWCTGAAIAFAVVGTASVIATRKV